MHCEKEIPFPARLARSFWPGKGTPSRRTPHRRNPPLPSAPAPRQRANSQSFPAPPPARRPAPQPPPDRATLSCGRPQTPPARSGAHRGPLQSPPAQAGAHLSFPAIVSRFSGSPLRALQTPPPPAEADCGLQNRSKIANSSPFRANHPYFQPGGQALRRSQKRATIPTRTHTLPNDA